MKNLSTTYMGIKLKNPIIIGSSGLTDSVEKIADLESKGAAAVVLKSIFEEEITLEYEQVLKEEANSRYKDDYLDYFDYKIKQDNLNKYLKLISGAKEKSDIPVIASVNCVSPHEWTYYAGKIEQAGADALELNIFLQPTDLEKTSDQKESLYFDILKKVKEDVKLPIAVKVSPYFTSPGKFYLELSKKDIQALVLFNRFYSPDFDVNNLEAIATNVLSTPQEMANTLRWVAILYDRLDCDIIASTGIHNGLAVVKQILAGANAVQIASALYKYGTGYLSEMFEEIESWMDKHNYESLDDFRGKMSQKEISNPAAFERMQFMKTFGEKKPD